MTRTISNPLVPRFSTLPSRVLAFGGKLGPRPDFPIDPWPVAVEVDPRGATALDVALILQDAHENAGADEYTADQLIAHTADTTCLPDEYIPGAWSLIPEDEEDPMGDPLFAALVRLITPEHERHTFTRGRFTGARTCDRCGLLPLDAMQTITRCPAVRP